MLSAIGSSGAIYIEILDSLGNFFLFLVDTGATISVLLSPIDRRLFINTNEVCKVNGISGSLLTLGKVSLDLFSKKKFVGKQNFHILPEKCSKLKCDGILGADFLFEYNAQINYENLTLSVTTFYQQNLLLPIITKIENIYNIPARSEIIIEHEVNTHAKEVIVLPMEICSGVFTAGILTKQIGNKIILRILNTRDKPVVIKNFKPKFENIENYEILNFDKTEKSQCRQNVLLNELDLKTLNEEEKQSITEICGKYQDIFHLPQDKLTYTNVYEQKIHLKENAIPKYTKPYRQPYHQKEEIKDQISKWLKNDLIEPSVSEWNSPLLLVPKKSINGEKKFRVVIDYRSLNKEIKDDKFPLPNIVDILDGLGKCKYFSCLDLSQGYYQVKLETKDRPCTAFSTENGHWQMKRMPQGLKISPSSFSRMMSIAMSGLTQENCFIYLDDIIVFGRNLIHHNSNLIKIFERLRKVNLKIHPNKCHFLRKEVLYLGHLITDKGILPDSSKSDAIKNYPIPNNQDETRSFVALANYYRRFIENFAVIALPLNRLLKKNVPFKWTSDCQESFEILKNKLISPKILQYPNFEQDFVLHTDASGFALGAVLANHDGKPVAYASRALKAAEINYSVPEKEMLAIVWAVKHFRPYLFGRHFMVKTDHRPLVYLFSVKDPSSRLTKFRITLSEYDFTIEYCPGKLNGAADALSRIKINSNDLKNLQVHIMTRHKTKIQQGKEENITNLPKTNDKIAQPDVCEVLRCPSEIPELKFIEDFEGEKYKKYKNHNVVMSKKRLVEYYPTLKILLLKLPRHSIKSLNEYQASIVQDVRFVCKECKISEVALLKKEMNKLNVILNVDSRKRAMNALMKIFEGTLVKILILPHIEKIENSEDKQIIIKDTHLLPTGGHSGINRMIRSIRLKYYWPNMRKDVEKLVKNCASCQKNKFQNIPKQPLEITTTSNSSFEKIFLDLVTIKPESFEGFKYILTIQDDLSKFSDAIPLKSKETEEVARNFVEKFICRYGIPKEICTDQGKEFISHLMFEICKILRIKKLQSSAYHHESLGSLERSHKVLGSFLRNFCEGQKLDWPSWLPYYVFCYNTSVHSATDYSPFELVYGKLCVLPSNLINENGKIDPIYNYNNYMHELKYRLQIAHKEARENLIKSKTLRKEKFDENTKMKIFDTGDLVLLKNEERSKLDKVFNGPFEVISDNHPNLTLNIKGKNVVVHKNRVRRFYEFVNTEFVFKIW
jgi:hypothetical protein